MAYDDGALDVPCVAPGGRERPAHDFDGLECRWCGAVPGDAFDPYTARDADHWGPCFDGCRHYRDGWGPLAQHTSRAQPEPRGA